MAPLSAQHSTHPGLAPSAAAAALPEIEALGLLNHLRMVALGCRASAKTNLFEACALLSLDGEDAKRTFADTLIKCLETSARRPITWFRPGVNELSFDEAWVMRCIACVRSGDADSLDFLLRSRIAASDRRYIGFLLGRISDQFQAA